ncbi:hypothetical protein Tco_0668362 [Tanacetum coccineum]
MAEGEINNLTMEQYLTLNRGNQEPGVVKPEIRGNVNFKIKSQFMRELREDTFSGIKNADAHEHVERILDIVSLFNILGVINDAVMLRVFPITLTGAAKRYNDMLYKCITPDINNHQKVNIFYNGLGTMNHQLLDSHGPITGMTPAQALTAIQTMADHSQNWYDGSSSRNINNSSNTEGIAAIVKLDSLGRDMKRLKENVHAIQVGCQTGMGAHLDKECPLNEEVKSMEEVKYGEFGKRRPSLTEIINKYMEEVTKRHVEQDEWLRKFYQNTETNRENHDKIIQGLETKMNPRCSGLLQNQLPPKEHGPGSSFSLVPSEY